MALIRARVFQGGGERRESLNAGNFYLFKKPGEIFRSVFAAISVPEISAMQADFNFFKNMEKKRGRSPAPWERISTL